jgi:hypothetical protein
MKRLLYSTGKRLLYEVTNDWPLAAGTRESDREPSRIVKSDDSVKAPNPVDLPTRFEPEPEAVKPVVA